MSISTSLQASVHGWALIQCSGLPVAGVPQAKQGVAHGRRVAVPAGGGEVVCPRVRGACAILPVPSSEANSGEARGLRGAGFTGFRWLRSSAFGRGVTCGERKLLTLGSAKSFCPYASESLQEVATFLLVWGEAGCLLPPPRCEARHTNPWP